MPAITAREARLRERIRRAGQELPPETWTKDELRALTVLLESIVDDRIDAPTPDNVVRLDEDRR